MQIARIRALAVVGALVVAAAVLVVITMTRDTQESGVQASACPAGHIPVVAKLPEQNSDVKIAVYNATNSVGLGEGIANDFANRKFTVVKLPNGKFATDETKKDEKGKTVKVTLGDKVAVLRYGPKALGAAHLLRAYFLNEAEYKLDLNRKDDVVDVVIGAEYKQLATPTEVNQAFTALGRPEIPDGTCAS